MDNYDVAHRFFYDLSGYFSKNYINVSYRNYKFFSYYTCIGKVVEDLDGRYILLVSEDNFSSTTAKHISNLIGACPFDRMRVPVNYGDSDININELENKIIKKLDYFKNQKLSQKYNRDEYCRYYTMLCEISHRVIKIKKSTITKYRKLYLELQDVEKVKALKKKQQILDRKAIEKSIKDFKKLIDTKNLDELKDWLKYNWNCNKVLYKQLKNYINDKTVESLTNGKNLLEIIACAYNSNIEWHIRQLLQEYLQNKYKDYSFVWIEGENFKTSKHVTIKIEDCKSLIRLYKSGKIKHGMQLNQYTILEVKNDYVRIGCHTISRENLDILLSSF